MTARGSLNPRTPLERSEVVIEGPVLLHHDDDVLDVFDGAGVVMGGDFQRSADTCRERCGKCTGTQ